MRRFNVSKVREIAIDKIDRQQLYVHDLEHRDQLFEMLFEMGFTTDLEHFTDRNAHLPIVVNTKEQTFHTIGAASYVGMALSQGARLLTFEELCALLDEPLVS